MPCGFDAGALRQIVRIGLPLGLNSALYSIGHVFLQVLYNLQESVFVAGCSVAGKEGRACWLLVNEGNPPIKTRLTLPGQEMAELTVNGQPAGVSFWPPHKFPLAGLLTPGKNTLTLTLTGSPANRYGKHPVPYGLDT